MAIFLEITKNATEFYPCFLISDGLHCFLYAVELPDHQPGWSHQAYRGMRNELFNGAFSLVGAHVAIRYTLLHEANSNRT